MAMFYEIKVQGKLKASWSEWFHGMTITFVVEGDGSPVTTLRGAVVDQTALHGLLCRIRDLGLPLLSVHRLSLEDPDINQTCRRMETWNDSLTGDYLWSNVNFGEAVTEVMTPLSWTVLKLIFGAWEILPGYDVVGNIGGRPYLNISLFASLHYSMGKGRQDLLNSFEGTLYMNLPEEMEIPVVSFSVGARLSMLSTIMRTRLRELIGWRDLPAYLASNPVWFRQIRRRIEETETRKELHALWFEALFPHVTRSIWPVMGSVTASTGYAMRLRRELRDLAGPEDADILLTTLNDQSGLLDSLGPVVGISRLARGEMDRQAYLDGYGHRGPHEFELSIPRPAEDKGWIDRQLEQYNQSPIDVDALLANQSSEFEVAWTRFTARNPGKAKKMYGRIGEVARRARLRERARSEYVRDRWAIRVFALRAGKLTGLEEDIFFLTVDELLAVLSGDETATSSIPVRMETYARYKGLPPYPSIINGCFDPFQWAADPDRRTDIFDSHAPQRRTKLESGRKTYIQGSPGSAGQVEGVVRRLDRPDDGNTLQKGEVLVTMQTDIAWTLLFPRAAAIVTDVGAPLSHAAIVARELGIPAVVGCGDATMRLKTGDRVWVDGARGIVKILDCDEKVSSNGNGGS